MARYPLKAIGELEVLGAIIEIQDGNHGEKHPKVDDYVDDGIPFVMARDLAEGVIDFTSCSFISEAMASTLRIGFARTGDVLLTHKGTLGDVAIVPEVNPFVVLTPQVTYYRTDGRKLSNVFLAYAFRDPQFRAGMRVVGDQGTRPYIGIQAQRKLFLRFPELTQQIRIAEFLSEYDTLIENNRRRMALLEESARLLYREWFVRLRFPGHERTKIVDGVPVGWSRKALGDVLTLKRGHDLPEQNRVEGEIPVVSSSGITGRHNAKKADPPGVVTGRCGTLGEVYYIDTEYWPLNTALYVSDFKEAEPLFAFYLLQATLNTIQSDKAAVPGVNRNVLHAMPILYPPALLRIEFVTIVNPMRAMIRKLTIQNEKLRGARDMLLPRLMSGEIEV